MDDLHSEGKATEDQVERTPKVRTVIFNTLHS